MRMDSGINGFGRIGRQLSCSTHDLSSTAVDHQRGKGERQGQQVRDADDLGIDELAVEVSVDRRDTAGEKDDEQESEDKEDHLADPISARSCLLVESIRSIPWRPIAHPSAVGP